MYTVRCGKYSYLRTKYGRNMVKVSFLYSLKYGCIFVSRSQIWPYVVTMHIVLPKPLYQC